MVTITTTISKRIIQLAYGCLHKECYWVFLFGGIIEKKLQKQFRSGFHTTITILFPSLENFLVVLKLV